MSLGKACLVAAHQPNFFPWLGYFDKIIKADIFIILDDVQVVKKGGGWSNRVGVLGPNGPANLTLPLDRAYHGLRDYRGMRINESTRWRETVRKTLRSFYGKSPGFRDVIETVETMVVNPTSSLLQYNLASLRGLLDLLGLPQDHLVLASAYGVRSQGTQRLIDLTRAVGGSAYLCGGGAQGYQDDALFEAASIGLVYQDFAHPTYPQAHGKGVFVPGLSLLDALFSLGVRGTRQLVTGA